VTSPRPLVALAGVLAASALAPRPAAAYEFEAHATTITQGFQLRSFRLFGGDVLLGRRRFTQALSLDIVDIGDLDARRRRFTPHRRGPVIRFTSYLRLDHDFGDWTMGVLPRGERTIDAIDQIPELESSSLALDLLYAYVDIDGLAAGAVDVRVGRQVRWDLLDSWAFDGATARVHTPWHLALEAAGGLRVRDASPLGPASYELDGTTGADCRELVEGATPGSGSWQIIDRSRVPAESRFTADFDYCPQREQAMPTIGVAVETEGFRRVSARLSYRRSASRTVGLIGDVDRLDYPDLGLYPEPQAPKWGIDEERVALIVHGNLPRGERVLVTPWAGVRWSLLHHVLDQAVAGARIRLGAHAIEPELARAVPTFDGDSIFNVFAAEPSTDARVGWNWIGPAAVRARASTWLRRYELDDGDAAYAGGADAGVEWRGAHRPHGDALALRLDGLADAGWGGDRLGGTATVRWRPLRNARYQLRAALLHLTDEGDREDPDVRAAASLFGSVTLGGTWELMPGVGFHAIAEGASSRITPAQLRLLGVLDLAFIPEI